MYLELKSVLKSSLYLILIFYELRSDYPLVQTIAKGESSKKEDIDFAFLSRTICMANDDKRQLKLKMVKV